MAETTPTTSNTSSNNDDNATQSSTTSTSTPTSTISDFAIMEQQKAIEEEAKTKALLSPLLPLSSLYDEYKSGSKLLFTKAKALETKYSKMRRVRGDGNCFIRAYIYMLFLHLHKLKQQSTSTTSSPSSSSSSQLLDDILQKVISSKEQLVSEGFSEFGIEDFWEVCVEELEEIKKSDTLTANDIYEKFNNNEISDYIVCYCRMLISAYIQRNAELYQYYITNGMSVNQFCQSQVEPMGVECDQPQIVALVNIFDVAVKIEYLDNSQSDETNSHIFPDGKKPNFTLLYRPGHYDLLFEETE